MSKKQFKLEPCILSKEVKITSDGTNANTRVTIEPGLNLGKIQEVTWEARIGKIPTAQLYTIITPVELSILQKDTKLKYIFDREYFWANFIHLFLCWICGTELFRCITKIFPNEERRRLSIQKSVKKFKTKLITEYIEEFMQKKLSSQELISKLNTFKIK